VGYQIHLQFAEARRSSTWEPATSAVSMLVRRKNNLFIKPKQEKVGQSDCPHQSSAYHFEYTALHKAPDPQEKT